MLLVQLTQVRVGEHMTFSIAPSGAWQLKGRMLTAVRCKAELLSGPQRFPRRSASQPAPENAHVETRAHDTPQKLQNEPQSVQLQLNSRSSQSSSQSKYSLTRHRLTVALMEEDLEGAIDSISECDSGILPVTCLNIT